jgi:hypothetical protein
MPISNREYNIESTQITANLATLRKISGLTHIESRKFKQEAVKYVVFRKKAWRLPTKSRPTKFAVNDAKMCGCILKDLHDLCGDREIERICHWVASLSSCLSHTPPT